MYLLEFTAKYNELYYLSVFTGVGYLNQMTRRINQSSRHRSKSNTFY